ncbi:helix-turn-helix transcriptional regulator [Ferrimonas balearica]|uniref:helix-turn-helix transcriptional regulator n=1 Tax=Ferrimonas balearica TaxID=44012 RepID=UPI001C995358|nr:helix-turn-helix transcriptional regulator [Ferrimonas balearica]MBY5992643.1 helix-turn-helix transcriptional regulator [Ferrimonas balearica]
MDTQNLIPELELIESLAPHWRKRFEKALLYLTVHLDRDPPPSWESVAEHCAISPHHFHRMFHSVFHEPPGQYLRRLRLQTAVHLLLSSERSSVTEVAHKTGFSSSQALAKALKRDLGTSAKAIRALGRAPGSVELQRLLDRLGHPGPETSPAPQALPSLERQLAQQLEIECQSLPTRTLQATRLPSADWEAYCQAAEQQPGTPLVLAAPITEQLDTRLADYPVHAGRWVSQAGPHTLTLPGGEHLCCQARLASESAYYGVWDRLVEEVLKRGWTLPDNGWGVEIIEQTDAIRTGVTVMTFQLPVRRP